MTRRQESPRPAAARARGRWSRFARLTLGEFRFATRYGILPLYGLISVLYLLLLSAVAPQARPQAGGVTILTDPAAMGLFFMGAMVLLEKSQHVDSALAVTPVRPGEYVLAKALALTGVGLVVGLVVAAVAGIGLLGAGLSVLLCGLLFSLVGMGVALRSASLNQFLLLAVPVEIFAFVPPLFYWFGGVSGALWLAHPGVAAMALFRDDLSLWPGAIASLLAWNALAFTLCRRTATDYFARVGGGGV